MKTMMKMKRIINNGDDRGPGILQQQSREKASHYYHSNYIKGNSNSNGSYYYTIVFCELKCFSIQ
jgi:hypothetical protein